MKENTLTLTMQQPIDPEILTVEINGQKFSRASLFDKVLTEVFAEASAKENKARDLEIVRLREEVKSLRKQLKNERKSTI
jgi:hypothetical protein